LVDYLLEGEPSDGHAIDMRDAVIGLQSTLGGRAFLNRRDDLYCAIVHRDFNADAPSLAPRLGLHGFVPASIELLRARIEGTKRALDGSLNHLLARQTTANFALDTAKEIAEHA